MIVHQILIKLELGQMSYGCNKLYAVLISCVLLVACDNLQQNDDDAIKTETSRQQGNHSQLMRDKVVIEISDDVSKQQADRYYQDAFASHDSIKEHVRILIHDGKDVTCKVKRGSLKSTIVFEWYEVIPEDVIPNPGQADPLHIVIVDTDNGKILYSIKPPN